MITIEADCEISGAAFSPARARELTGLRLPNGSEPGAPSKKPARPRREAGYARLNLEAEGIDPGDAEVEEALLSLVEEYASLLREAGAEEFQMWLYVDYQGQCNMEFSPEYLGRLARMGMPLLISCYQGSEDESPRRGELSAGT